VASAHQPEKRRRLSKATPGLPLGVLGVCGLSNGQESVPSSIGSGSPNHSANHGDTGNRHMEHSPKSVVVDCREVAHQAEDNRGCPATPRDIARYLAPPRHWPQLSVTHTDNHASKSAR